MPGRRGHYAFPDPTTGEPRTTPRYGYAPADLELDPATGPAGTEVTITGANLADVTDVTFGTVAGTSLDVISATELTVVVPAGTGEVDVTVTNPNGATVLADAWLYAAE